MPASLLVVAALYLATAQPGEPSPTVALDDAGNLQSVSMFIALPCLALFKNDACMHILIIFPFCN